MTRSVKIIPLLLALVLCVNLLGLTATATDFDCGMVLTPYNTTEKLMISVDTTQAAGAITGKMVFDNNLVDFDSENTVWVEGSAASRDMYRVEGNTITFLIAADDLTNGQTKWIDFAFDVKETGSAVFTVTDVQVSDVNGNVSSSLSVAPVTIGVDGSVTEILGAQYRPATEENGNVAALRFGAKLYRSAGTNQIVIDGEEKTALSCGFILGFEGNIKAANGDAVPELSAKLDTETGKVHSITSGAVLSKSVKAYSTTDSYLVHTIAITGIGESTTATIGGVENVLVKNAPIIARAYVVYQNADGSFGIAYTQQISRTFTEVDQSYTMVEG